MAKHSPEDELVARILRGFPDSRAAGLRLGVGDDAALWQPPHGHQAILTSDWFLEGSHFLRDKHPADSVGWKCLARAVSDIAAMGGAPRCFLLNLGIPASHAGKWLDGFLVGLRRAAKLLRCSMAGGDTTQNEQILVNVTVVGEVAKGQAVLRSGARPGDLLFVTGTLGEAELGLKRLRQSKGKVRAADPTLRKHLYPQPRIALGAWLAKHRLASAMMDISDGLSTDLARLCKASGVGALVDECAVPYPDGIPKPEAIRLGLHGGDEYELLFTSSPAQARRLPGIFEGLRITPIGRISQRREVVLLKDDASAVPFKPSGWDPFRK
jgi:thiamine-monophosphate kinase